MAAIVNDQQNLSILLLSLWAQLALAALIPLANLSSYPLPLPPTSTAAPPLLSCVWLYQCLAPAGIFAAEPLARKGSELPEQSYTGIYSIGVLKYDWMHICLPLLLSNRRAGTPESFTGCLRCWWRAHSAERAARSGMLGMSLRVCLSICMNHSVCSRRAPDFRRR